MYNSKELIKIKTQQNNIKLPYVTFIDGSLGE